MTLKDLQKLFKDNAANITVNVVVNAPVKPAIDTDFEVGDEVLVCHRRKDGTPVHTNGVVDSIDTDDVGDYVRVTGDNGKHYKCGTHYNEVRKGTCIVLMDN
jgi:hypothetical protein